jgi:glycosyltransferase involved in cell wall biosynthesis
MREVVNGVKVIRTWLFPSANRGSYGRMLNYSSFCVSSAVTGLFLSSPDVVIATSPQLLVALSGWWIAESKRTPFVFEVRDLWPESLAAVGMGEPDSWLHRGLGKIAGFLYQRCDRIVVVSAAFQQHLVEKWGLPVHKISIAENGVETDLFSPGDADRELRDEVGARGRFVVAYIGTMGMAHGLETLIEAAARLQNSAPNVLVLLVGEGAEKEHIEALAQSRGLKNMRFVGQQPRERIPAYIRLADACLVMLKKTELFKTVIPTKMLEFMSCGRPLILGVDGQARKIMEEAQAGIFVEPGDVEALVQAVTQLAGNAEMRASLGGNGRRYILQFLSREQTAKRYIQVLTELIKGHSN